jgi:hypothetical protein
MKIKDYCTLVLETSWSSLTYNILELENRTIGYGKSRILGKIHAVIDFLKDVRRHIAGRDVHDFEDLDRRFTLLDFGSAGEGFMTG